MSIKIRDIIKPAALILCAIILLSGCAASGDAPDTVTGGAPKSQDIVFESIEDAQTDAPETETPGSAYTPDDTEPPFFLNIASNVTLYRGAEFELNNYISYIDDCDPDVELTVAGDVDTEVVGEYPLALTLTDDAGNHTVADMTVNVKEPVRTGASQKTEQTEPEAPKSFEEFSASYKKEGTSVGIDVSRWQGDIDFEKVAAAGAEFVIIRIGGYADELFEDRCYKNNIKNAKAAGLKVGVYWYSEENGAKMVREDADYLYSLLDGEELDFPVFFDWEDFAHFQDHKMSMRDLNEMFLAFREEAEARGYRAALYNSKSFLRILWSDEVKEGGVWLAHYIDETNYDGAYFLWQQGYGRIDGIYGDVDVDVFYPGEMP